MPLQYFRPGVFGGIPTISGAGPRIGITGTPSEQASAVNGLINIVRIVAGYALLAAIDARLAIGGACVSVAPWDHQVTNKCAALGGVNAGDNAKTTLAQTLEFNQANVHAALTAALNAAGHAGNYAWLAAQICAHPIPHIIGVPAVAASQTVHGANWVTQLMVQNWATNAVQFPGPLVGQRATDAALILVAVLRTGLTVGPGSHARVHWSVLGVSSTDTIGVVHARPPFLALAHELIHAYHDIAGTQTGHDIGTPSGCCMRICVSGLETGRQSRSAKMPSGPRLVFRCVPATRAELVLARATPETQVSEVRPGAPGCYQG